MYGIIIDSLIVSKNQIKEGESFSEILQRYNVGVRKIREILNKSDKIFDFTKIIAGKNYTFLLKKDSINTADYFIYEISPISFVVVSLGKEINVYRDRNKVTKVLKTASGIINTSLWNAMISNKTNTELSLELSEIFAWSIDFFGIQKGDEYKAIYDELIVNDKNIGVGKVYAAYFKHSGRNYYAFYFHKDSVNGYYDEQGNNLKRSFLKAPLRYSRISSRFSNSRFHPILKIRRPHHGVDYAAPIGTPVHSIGKGKVISLGRKKEAGRIIKIKHEGSYVSSYMHLSKFAKGLKVGKLVKQGETIGFVGSSGLSTGPHLDFRIYRNGIAINPLKVNSKPLKALDSNYHPEFELIKNKFKEKLDNINIYTTSKKVE